MIRQLLISLTFFFTWSAVNAQTLIGKSQDGKVEVYTYFFKFKKGQNWDTINFDGDNINLDTCTIQTVQIDGKGLKEVIMTWSTHLWHSYGGPFGGGFDQNYVRNVIWNLDTRKEIFSATNEYSMQNDNCTGDIDSTGEPINVTCILDNCSYSYDFVVTAKGEIMIKNLNKNYSVTTTYYENETEEEHEITETDSSKICLYAQPDNKEGIYIFKNGQFILRKN